ncbi:hypothetical protein L6164_009429 [Bauhinia variegata]|uniref:Uncharacterized protein n=1 Tax=Bauhinia variegata TaxID=167791 RepID=A0ACB9PJW9_BAUVA|nr:hypothetical protein L6164_009429 [Bauhinia variegata]
MKLTIDNIKAFILDLFMAGTHTAAITTEWAMAELINHPHLMEKARHEIDSVVPTNLAVMIQCFEWKIHGGKDTVDMQEKTGMTLPRAYPLNCVPVPRLNPFPSISN